MRELLAELTKHMAGSYSAHVLQLAIPCLGGALLTAILGLLYKLSGG